MPFYEYETIPAKDGDPVKRYEFRQSMSEEPYKKHPETGEPLRRVYSAFAVGGAGSSDSCGCGGGNCACQSGGHHHHGGGCSCGCCG
jgi:predicted nucleic acid-binding Zn ribbon protein